MDIGRIKTGGSNDASQRSRFHCYGRFVGDRALDGYCSVRARRESRPAASVEEIDPAIFDEIFHLNVLAPIVAMQAVIPLMRAQGGGSIVNINSGTAFMTVPQYSVYSSSKRALLGFSLTARAELEKDRIVVSEIYPFITATNFGKNRMGNPAGGGPSSNYAEGDTPEFVAGLVLQAIEEGQAQYFANDRLRKMAGSRFKLKRNRDRRRRRQAILPSPVSSSEGGVDGLE